MIQTIAKLFLIGLWLLGALPLESVYIQEPTNSANQALIKAAKDGNREDVEVALNAGADSNYVDNNGNTPLIWAACKKNTEIVRMLIEHGAHVNIHVNHTDMYGRTALMVATGNGCIDIVRILIEAGADVHHTDDHGETSLMLGARTGYANIVRLLIEHDADVNHTDKEGETALMRAAANSKGDIVRLLLECGARLPTRQEQIQMLKDLLKKTIGHNFIIEVIFSSAERISQLLGQSPRELTHAPDTTGKTALHWATQGNSALVRLLLDHDFDINTQDGDGNTPLHVAARNGSLSTVKLLLAHGANPTLVNGYGNSCLALARQYHHPDLVAFLEEQAGRTVFGRISRLGRGGGFAWQSAGQPLPHELAQHIAQFALAPGHPILPSSSNS